MKRKKIFKYEEMFPEDFFREIQKTPVSYFTFGGLEVHGPHNAVGNDGFLPYYIALKCARNTGGIVFPPVFAACPCFPPLRWQELKSYTKDLSRPSFWNSREFIEKMLEEALWNFEKLGFLVCVLIPGHAPNIAIAKDFCEGINFRNGKLAIYLANLIDNRYMKNYTEEERTHAGIWESSLLKALRYDLSDPSRIKKFLAGDRGAIPPNEQLQWEPHKIKDPSLIKAEKSRPYIKEVTSTISKEVVALLESQRTNEKKC